MTSKIVHKPYNKKHCKIYVLKLWGFWDLGFWENIFWEFGILEKYILGFWENIFWEFGNLGFRWKKWLRWRAPVG